MEIDLARAHRRTSGVVDLQLVQLRPLSETEADSVLVIRMDTDIIRNRINDPKWQSFREQCLSIDQGRTLESIAKIYAELKLDNAQSIAQRAWVDRMARLGRHASATFGTFDGEDINHLGTLGTGDSYTARIEPIIEVTMDVAIMSELLNSMVAVSQEEP